jgi:Na+-driven multidrug efflux pump
MLIPRFTIRTLLVLTTVCSVLAFVGGLAVRGQAWATAVSVAVGSLVLTLLCYGTFFGLAFVIASLHGALRAKSRGGTPFATVEPPPQIIPPEEPE